MKIIKVEPVVPMLSLTWMIGSRCNYACSYCPTDLHDNYSPHPELEKLTKSWDNFYKATTATGLPYKISFTGGEVTANKNFLPLVEYIRNGDYNIGQIVVTTNGSASLAYYLRLATIVDTISFSTHSEFWDESKFFNTVIEVNRVMQRPKKSVHVNIMDEANVRHRFKQFEELLSNNNVSYSINAID